MNTPAPIDLARLRAICEKAAEGTNPEEKKRNANEFADAVSPITLLALVSALEIATEALRGVAHGFTVIIRGEHHADRHDFPVITEDKILITPETKKARTALQRLAQLGIGEGT